MLADFGQTLAVGSKQCTDTVNCLLLTAYFIKKGYWGAILFDAPLPPLLTTHYALLSKTNQ